MTDYSLWEVILNGDSPAHTRVVEGVLQSVAPTTAEQKLARRNELKARGTLLIALPDEHQLKFNFHKDAKTLMEAIEKSLPSEWKTHTLIWRNKVDWEEQSLDDLFNSLKIYEAKVKHSSSTGATTQNLAFVSSSNSDSTAESVSAASSISAVCAKMHVSSLPNVDSLSNAMAILTMRARRFLQKTRKNLRANGHTSMGFDMSKAKCYNCYRKGHFARKCRSPKDLRRNGAAEPQRRTVLVETSTSNALVSQCLESVEARLLVYKQNEYVFEENIKLLNIKVQLRDTALVTLRQKLEKAEQEMDDLKLKLEKFQTSSKNLTELLASQTNEKTGLGYNSQVFTRAMFDCDDYLSSESDESWPLSSLYDRFQPYDGYHVVPPPYTGTFMPPKPDLVFNTALTTVETNHSSFTVQLSPTKPEQDLSHTNRPTAPIIEDWVSDSKDESETKAPQIIPSFKMAQPTPRNHAHMDNYKQYAPLTHQNPQKHMVLAELLTQSKPISITAVRPVSAVVTKIKVTRPRHANPIITKSNSPIRRHLTRSPSPKASNSPPRVTAVKALVGNLQHALKDKEDKEVTDSGCLWHMTGYMSYLSNFEELNSGYVAFGGNPKGGKIYEKGKIRTWNMSSLSNFEELSGGYVSFGGNPKGGKISGKRKIKTGKLDFYDVYFVKELKFNLFSVSQMCDKKISFLFTDTECLVLSPDFKLPDESQVLLRVPRENNMYNVNLKNIVPSGDLTCLFAKATIDESNLWHRRLGHINFKTMNKLTFITGLENQLSLKVKVIRSDNGTEFNNNNLNQFCGMKEIKREFSVPRNPQQNGIAERKNRTLIEVARTILADSLLPIPFWAEAVNTACYVQNRVLVTKPQNKTPYELLHGRTPSIGFIRPFGCPVTILNTLDSLGEEYDQQYVLFPVWSSGYTNPQNKDGDAAFDGKEPDFDAKKPESEVNVSPSISAQLRKKDDKTRKEAKGKSPVESFTRYRDLSADTNTFSVAGPSNAVASPTHGKSSFIDAFQLFDDPDMPELEDITYSDDEDDVGAEADFNNLETSITEESKRVYQALKDPSWIEAMQEELLQFKMQKVWVLVDLPHGKRAIGFEDPAHPDKVYKVVKALYGLHQAPRAWYETLADYLLENGFQRGFHPISLLSLTKPHHFNTMFFDQPRPPEEGKSASTPIDTEKPLLKDPDGKDVDVHTYRLMIGSLMYLTSSRPDIMFANWLVQKQTALGKDKSNLLTVDSLLKTIRSSIHHLPINEVLTIPGQTATAKEISNPFMTGVNTPRSDEDRLELIELTVFLLPNVEIIGIGVNAVDLQASAVRQKLLLFSLTNWCCSLSAVSSIKYELTVNPNIYVSYIKQFLTTIAVKQMNDITRLQALVDKKKVVVMEATIQEALHLDDEEGVDCLPNEEIFAELARIGYEKPSTKLTFYKAFFSSQWKFLIHIILQCMSAKRTSWNGFSSSMAFVFICLSSGRKFTFLRDLSTHTTKYTSPALTQKVFANIRRVGKGFSGVERPLFEGMLVEQQVNEEGDADENVKEVNASDAAEGDVSVAHGEVQPPSIQPQPQSQPQQAAEFPMSLVQEVIDTCAALTRRVEHLEFDKVALALEITKLKRRVKKLKRRNTVRKLKFRRLQRVGTSQRVETPDETVLDDVSNQGRMIAKMDQDDAVVSEDDKEDDRIAESQAEIYKIDIDHANKVLSMQEDEAEPAEVQEVVDVVTTAKLITKVVTAANETVTAASAIITTIETQVPTATLIVALARVSAAPSRKRKGVMDYFKGMSYDDIPSIFEAKFNSNVAFLLKTKEQIEKDENRALQKLNETPAEREAKRRKLDEEIKELKRHLQIVPNEDDDVYTEATPLARKVPVVDY
nr:ribonuclease H-like domain-containing protein [Tanacetum cinerariifolium]